MKALSLTQPWASAIMLGYKKIETRSWKTSYKGRIAIHAAKGFPTWAREFAEVERALGRIPGKLPFGAIIGFVRICGMQKTQSLSNISGLERLYGDYSPGRWAWFLDDIEPLPDDKIVPCKGMLGLWEVPTEILRPCIYCKNQGKDTSQYPCSVCAFI
jgi:hypothetical protein